ncbi:proto-oncogene Mas-like [Anolis carolinensis]|uniref:G-protein coupled receptors family 1 profile domain-containing protein n=1 Tax=Anolis carolinensis TaxID=28377 RepID=G1KUN4_ANOCA|nr:PREDICTED: proto-oncogene Mas-like [Anolis carolinensis]|eukprot:XP_016848443.1 PREDICTED: proto-oncogene Mas-like [Anolis carolinensis]
MKAEIWKMTNFSTKFLSLLNSSNMFYLMDLENEAYSDGYLQAANNGISVGNVSYCDTNSSSLEVWSVSVLTMGICFSGLIGNGTIIWFLTLSIPRNPFTTFILNLAVADFGVLLSIPLILILYHLNVSVIPLYWEDLFMCIYTPGHFLLVAISFDRCVSVYFPIWHRCHRSKYFSSIVCAVIWVLSFLLCGIPLMLILIHANIYDLAMFYVSALMSLLCLPLMIISTLSLFIKVCLKPTQHQRGNILTAILLTLLFFIILALPFNIVFCVFYLSFGNSFSRSVYGFLFASLNSSVNPLIYFLVGRRKRGKYRESVKVIFQRIFSDEKDCRQSRPKVIFKCKRKEFWRSPPTNQ